MIHTMTKELDISDVIAAQNRALTVPGSADETRRRRRSGLTHRKHKPRSDRGSRRSIYGGVPVGERARMRRLRDAQRDAQREQERCDARRYNARDAAATDERLTRAERRLQRREALLPADRVCRSCGEIKPSSRQWVVITEKLEKPIAMCVSCYRELKAMARRQSDGQT